MYDQAALRDMKGRMPRKEQKENAIETIDQLLGANPRPPNSEQLDGRGAYRVRVLRQAYTVLYEVDDDARMVYVRRVRHRRDTR